MFGLGATEIIVLAGVLVLLFGSKKIADLAQGVSDAIKIFRNTLKDDEKKPEKIGTTDTTEKTENVEKIDNKN